MQAGPKKIAVILFNLGGPDGPDAVKPFLRNLFSDPAIIALPQPLRWLVAKLISSRRAPVAREIYAHLGGSSPLLRWTQAQAEALENLLNGGGDERGQQAEPLVGEAVRLMGNSGEFPGANAIYKVYITMRYWHPMAAETAVAVKDWQPDEIVLLPLYPQFSTTTTGSSLKDWNRYARAAGLDAPTRAVCCYPDAIGLAQAHAALLREALAQLPAGQPARILFSAHGLPQKVVDAGDPYQWQVERTATAVMKLLVEGQQARVSPERASSQNQEDFAGSKTNHSISYQSKVGPLKWLEPSTEDEIRRAGAEGMALVIVPIAFVSEHSETLVELDIEYAQLAKEAGVPHYLRVPALNLQADFIAALANAVNAAPPGICPVGGKRICPSSFGQCPATCE